MPGNYSLSIMVTDSQLPLALTWLPDSLPDHEVCVGGAICVLYCSGLESDEWVMDSCPFFLYSLSQCLVFIMIRRHRKTSNVSM